MSDTWAIAGISGHGSSGLRAMMTLMSGEAPGAATTVALLHVPLVKDRRRRRRRDAVVTIAISKAMGHLIRLRIAACSPHHRHLALRSRQMLRRKMIRNAVRLRRSCSAWPQT